MAASVQKRVEDSVITMAFDELTDQKMVTDAYVESLKLAGESDGVPYRVLDLRNAGKSFAMIVTSLRELAKGVSGAGVFPEMLYVVIGNPDMAEFCMNVKLPFFTTYTEGLAYLQSQVDDSVRVM